MHTFSLLSLQKSGFGVYVQVGGERYEGLYERDHRHGLGKLTDGDGNVYEGMFHEDKKQGKGKMAFANGDTYEGDYVNGKMDGKGVFFTAATGETFSGTFLAGLRGARDGEGGGTRDGEGGGDVQTDATLPKKNKFELNL